MASDVSPKLLRSVPARTSFVAGRQREVTRRSRPVLDFMLQRLSLTGRRSRPPNCRPDRR